jgi:hypothetical protein
MFETFDIVPNAKPILDIITTLNKKLDDQNVLMSDISDYMLSESENIETNTLSSATVTDWGKPSYIKTLQKPKIEIRGNSIRITIPNRKKENKRRSDNNRLGKYISDVTEIAVRYVNS